MRCVVDGGPRGGAPARAGQARRPHADVRERAQRAAAARVGHRRGRAHGQLLRVPAQVLAAHGPHTQQVPCVALLIARSAHCSCTRRLV